MNLQDLHTRLYDEIVTPDAAEFLIALHEKFENLRCHLLMKRRTYSRECTECAPHFHESTRSIREANWKIPEAPRDMQDRRVEITGPAEPKMMINALNSGAQVFMADLEDSLSPTWQNVLQGQEALKKAVRRELTYTNEQGKTYRLNEKLATLVMRPRGLHLEEAHFQIRGHSISASLFDFGLYFFHNAHELIKRNTAPYIYLPKLENHEEAAWWHEVFLFSEDRLHIPRGAIRATVLIETITAAFEMDEILYSLGEHALALNAGRWDYIFSLIKNFHDKKDFILPDRNLVTMNTPFMEAYCRLLVQTCHRRGAHAIGGMAAFIPNRRNPELNQNALRKVSADKTREAHLGFDGTWVAHPDLVPIAFEEFSQILAVEPHQKNVIPEDPVQAADLLKIPTAKGLISEMGVRSNINICLRYLNFWLAGTGAAAIDNLMEDAATAEISRSQLWQWLHHEVTLSNGEVFTPDKYQVIMQEEFTKLVGDGMKYLDRAASLLNFLVLAEEFPPFLTTFAYEILNQIENKGEPHVQPRSTVTSARL